MADLYELRDKETGFFDAETGLKIVRAQQKEVDADLAGTATLQAIKNGALVVAKQSDAVEVDLTKQSKGIGKTSRTNQTEK